MTKWIYDGYSYLVYININYIQLQQLPQNHIKLKCFDQIKGKTTFDVKKED